MISRRWSDDFPCTLSIFHWTAFSLQTRLCPDLAKGLYTHILDESAEF